MSALLFRRINLDLPRKSGGPSRTGNGASSFTLLLSLQKSVQQGALGAVSKQPILVKCKRQLLAKTRKKDPNASISVIRGFNMKIFQSFFCFVRLCSNS